MSREKKHEEEEKGGELKENQEEINTSEMAAKKGTRSQITRANTVCANNVCACVHVSQVSAWRVITVEANGDKVSNLVHNMSLALFKANGDLLRSHARCLSRRWK